jgi:hypothetical protein
MIIEDRDLSPTKNILDVALVAHRFELDHCGSRQLLPRKERIIIRDIRVSDVAILWWPIGILSPERNLT